MAHAEQGGTAADPGGGGVGIAAHVLDQPDVVSGLLFGSQATGRAGPLSDIDIGVWLQPDLSREARAEKRLDLLAQLTRALRSDHIDLVVLNDAPPLLRHRAIRDGLRLLERDRSQRVRFERDALIEYLDTNFLRQILNEGVRRRIRDGRFGRR